MKHIVSTPIYTTIQHVARVIRAFGLRFAMDFFATTMSLLDLRFYMRAAYLTGV